MNENYPLALPEGTVLAGQYVIEKVLGQGGFGITYRAVDHKSGQKVAVKEFFPDSLATRQATTAIPFSGERGDSFSYGKTCFLQEAQTLAQFIGNENIVRIHTYFEENGTAYFVMDYIEGTSLDVYIKEHGGRLDWEETAKILIPVMDALGAVHEKGIVHRDVTPDNIYITKDGTIKLLDFGAARYSVGDKSRSLDIVLKHGFAPKEQYARHGRQGPFTDVYALGATFYYALTGKRPPDSVERMDEDDLVPPNTLGVKLPEAVENAILMALSVQPQDRFQTMAAFKNAMKISQAKAMAENTQPAPAVIQQVVAPAAPVQPQYVTPSQQIPVSQQVPVSQQIPVSQQVPVSQQIPVSQQVPVSQQIPASQQIPVSQQGYQTAYPGQTVMAPQGYAPTQAVPAAAPAPAKPKSKKPLIATLIAVGSVVMAAAVVAVIVIAVKNAGGLNEPTVTTERTRRTHDTSDVTTTETTRQTKKTTETKATTEGTTSSKETTKPTEDTKETPATSDTSLTDPTQNTKYAFNSKVETRGNSSNNINQKDNLVYDKDSGDFYYTDFVNGGLVRDSDGKHLTKKTAYYVHKTNKNIWFVQTENKKSAVYFFETDTGEVKKSSYLPDDALITGYHIGYNPDADAWYDYLTDSKNKITCYDGDGKKVASIETDGQYVFNEGYIYYTLCSTDGIKRSGSETYVWRVPMDNLKATPDCLTHIGTLKVIRLVAEGNYIYILYKDGSNYNLAKQRLTDGKIVVDTTFESDKMPNSSSINVCGNYVYWVHCDPNKDKPNKSTIYRWKAEEGENPEEWYSYKGLIDSLNVVEVKGENFLYCKTKADYTIHLLSTTDKTKTTDVKLNKN